MKRVVVYSSSAEFMAMIDGIVCGSGIEVLDCDGEDALDRICRTARVDCVVVDGTRRFIDGSDILRCLRRTEGRRPQIFVLASDQTEEMVVAMLGSGVSQYISLPVDPLRLRHKLCGGSCGYGDLF